MQKGTVVNLRQLKGVIDFIKANWCLITLTIAFLFGISFGTYLTRENDNFFEFIKKLTFNIIETKNTDNFLSVLISSFIFNTCFLVLIFVFGASITGITLAPIIIFIRGLLFGGIVSSVYLEYSLKGIAFAALVLIPPAVISVIFLIAVAKDSMKFSLIVISVTLPEAKPKNLSFHFNRYWKRCLITLIPTILTSILDAWLSVKLINYFEL